MDDDKKTIQRLEDELTDMCRRFAEVEESQKNLRLRDEALQKSEERFRSLIQNSLDIIFIIYENRDHSP